MKRNICVIFAIFAFFLGSFVQLIAQNATPVSDFRYMINADCTGIVIKRYKGREKDVIIPSTIENYPVVELFTLAFYNNYYLESITIPNSVKKIGGFTFAMCSKLKTVNIGANNIEYTNEIPFFGIVGTYATHPSGNMAFMDCVALSLEEQKKIRRTGYKGYF